MFLCELSMKLCLIYKTKCYEVRMSCLNQTRQSERSFTPFVLTTDSSTWIVSESKRASVSKTLEYLQGSLTVSSVDKIAAVIVISICFWHDMTLTFSMIKCQTISIWMPVGGAYVDVLLRRRCLCKQLCLADVTMSHIGFKTSRFLRVITWMLFIDDEEILSYETCRMY